MVTDFYQLGEPKNAKKIKNIKKTMTILARINLFDRGIIKIG